MDVGEWLRSLGLDRYEAAFRDNSIGADVLCDLTEEDLAELGVTLGDRKRLLRAIAQLAQTRLAVKSRRRPPAAMDLGERRQLTVMFCDLVGSTAMSARLDPEDMREVIHAYHDAAASAVARYDGFVARLMGDGVLAYFGFPGAHEDDAERAVRAGTEIAADVAKLETRAVEGLRVRIGIATGIVVVGDLVGEGSAQEQAVVGETPNLAARLQALAEPGSVVIAETTRRLLGGAFELRASGPHALKGFDAPIPVWTVLREADHVSRFEASRSEAMTPFVGREQEVGLLTERWRDAAAGEGHLVLLSGEAGIGKSRILAELRERIGAEPHLAMRYQCSPHHINDAFFPISGQIWHAAGLVAGESSEARLDKLEALFALSGLEARDVVPLIASLLSIPGGERYPAPELSPSEMKERTVEVLIASLVGVTSTAPVLALLEDAHWIDPTTLEVFGRLVDRLPGMRALVVVTARPEFTASWLGRGHVTAHALNRFGRRQALTMIDRVAGGKPLPPEVTEQIVAKTDGVPLFMEELTKTVLESGLLKQESGAFVLASALTPLAIPSTLQDSLMARLDRLAPVRETAQIAAAIGREFSLRLLEAVSPIRGPALQDALDQLMAAELIYGRGAPPEANYVFKHALVQDTAYASLLRGRRQRIHADIAAALLESFPDQVDSAPAVVAHHFTEAGQHEPAARHWLAAAELALSRSSPLEAARHVEAGLAAIGRLPAGAGRRSLELALTVARANAFSPLKGYSAPETVAALVEAKALLDAGTGSEMQRFSVLCGLCLAYCVMAQTQSALALARQIVEIAEKQEDSIYRLIGYRLLATTQLWTGMHVEALESLQRGEEYSDPGRQKSLSFRFSIDPGLIIPCYKIQALMFLGRNDEAARIREEVRAEIANHAHASTIATCNYVAYAFPELAFGDFESCERQNAELVAYCVEKNVQMIRIGGVVCHACARAAREPTPENVGAIRAALAAQRRSGVRLQDSLSITLLAEALLAAGELAAAQEALREAFAFVEQSGERFWLSELHRVEGRTAHAAADASRAQACFLKAIEIARGQQARLLELRAATDLARLWRDADSPYDIRALLTPLLATISGGEDLRDVRSARELLANVASM